MDFHEGEVRQGHSRGGTEGGTVDGTRLRERDPGVTDGSRGRLAT